VRNRELSQCGWLLRLILQGGIMWIVHAMVLGVVLTFLLSLVSEPPPNRR